MTYSSINPEQSQDLFNQYHQELVDDLLLQDSIYPWDLKELETEAYINQIENQFSPSWTNNEIETKAEKFFVRFNQCWEENSFCPTYNLLSEQFGKIIPHSLLQSLSSEVERVIGLNLNPLDRLIASVKSSLGAWVEVDLQVFARPLVYGMRGEKLPCEDLIEGLMSRKSWDQLSEIEKAKVTLAIAQYGLNSANLKR
jgi:hypothetical protein